VRDSKGKKSACSLCLLTPFCLISRRLAGTGSNFPPLPAPVTPALSPCLLTALAHFGGERCGWGSEAQGAEVRATRGRDAEGFSGEVQAVGAGGVGRDGFWGTADHPKYAEAPSLVCLPRTWRLERSWSSSRLVRHPAPPGNDPRLKPCEGVRNVPRPCT